MMKIDPKLTRYAARRHSITIIQMAVAVLLLADSAAAQPAQSCAQPAAAVTSNVSDNACKPKTRIGSAELNEFPAWKTVNLGVYHDANAVRQAVSIGPELLYIDSWADQMLNRIYLSADSHSVEPCSDYSVLHGIR